MQTEQAEQEKSGLKQHTEAGVLKSMRIRVSNHCEQKTNVQHDLLMGIVTAAKLPNGFHSAGCAESSSYNAFLLNCNTPSEPTRNACNGAASQKSMAEKRQRKKMLKERARRSGGIRVPPAHGIFTQKNG